MVAAGKRTKSPPIACSSAASPRGIGRHQRPRAGLRERRGDGERRAFVAARSERRDDLEDRTAGERRVRPAPEGRERVEAHGRPRLEHESVTGERLTCSEGSAKPASPCAPAPSSSRRGPQAASSKASLCVGRTAAGLHRRKRPESTAYRLSPPCASAQRRPRPCLAQRLSLRHGLDQGERARRGSRAARSRPPQVRLFRPWAIRRAARGWDDLALARGDAGARSGPERGAANSRRLVDGRISGAARRPGAQRGWRDGPRQRPHSYRARGRLHRSAHLGQGAGRGAARDHG